MTEQRDVPTLNDRSVTDAQERLLQAIGDTLVAPAPQAKQDEMVDAIENLKLAVAREVVDKRRGSVLRVQALCEIENAKDADRRKLVSLRSVEVEAQIAACPTPYYHDTHRYCPSCPWTEER